MENNEKNSPAWETEAGFVIPHGRLFPATKGNSMRLLRSITFGLIGLAMAFCAAMPAAASVPIDPGIHVMTPAYPAPTIATVDLAV